MCSSVEGQLWSLRQKVVSLRLVFVDRNVIRLGPGTEVDQPAGLGAKRTESTVIVPHDRGAALRGSQKRRTRRAHRLQNITSNIALKL